MESGGMTPEDEQERWLEDASQVVRHQSFLMKRALDNGSLMDALKHASNLICELRTSLLGPKRYFSLYMQVCDQLRHLEMYFADEHRKGKNLLELYELVQHAGNILPRLYLLVTVGSVYIKSLEAPARDVLRDMAEMTRGVQHATRGLFLRHHLSTLTKDKLPDTGNEYSGDGGDVRDSIDFIVSNFTEMNKLWVRMQHQGPARDRDRREKERQELRLLVGTNLVRLSQLEGVTPALYSEVVLPRVLEQVINCKDQIAQQYLMDCVIQVFPDDFHLRTLEPVLSACGQLHEAVNVTTIVMSLLERLRIYATQNKDLVPEDIRVFDIFTTHIAKIIQQRSNMQLVDILNIQLALLNFALRCYPGNLAYVDQVLEFCAHVLHRMSRDGKQKLENPACVRLVVQLLTALLDLDASKNQVLVILEFDNYPELMQYLHVGTRKTVAMSIVHSVLKHRVPLDDHDKVSKLLAFLKPLIKDDPESAGEEVDREDFEEEQHLVARLVHLFDHEDTDELFRIYSLVRKHFGQGGTQRIAHTLPPLVFRCLELAQRVRAREEQGDEIRVTCRKVFQFAHEAISALAAEYPEVALRLFLQSAMAADACGFETICYEFVTQGFIIFEDELAASKAQYAAIILIIGTLQRLTCFTEENNETLVTKAVLYGAKLLKKPDQCRAISAASHLFWSPHESGLRNGKRVLECLQKALKIADTCMAASLNVLLFIEILNQYVYYFANKNKMVTAKYLSSLIDLIQTNISSTDPSEGSRAIHALFRQTIAYIQAKKESEGGEWRDIVLDAAE